MQQDRVLIALVHMGPGQRPAEHVHQSMSTLLSWVVFCHGRGVLSVSFSSDYSTRIKHLIHKRKI